MLMLPARLEAPSLSVTVTLMGKLPLGWPTGLSRYWWATPLKLSRPAARLTVVLAEPSPQLIVTVCVSSVPGSVKLPLRVVELPSLMLVALRDRLTLAGATLLTVTLVVAVGLTP